MVLLGVGKGVLFREVSSVQNCPHREREREVPIQLTVARPVDVPHPHCTSKPASSRPT